MLDRSKAPKIFTDFNVELGDVLCFQLSDGPNIYSIPTAGAEVIKIEFIYKAGRTNEQKRAQARMTVKSVFEGSDSMTGEAFNELMDFHGAVCNSNPGMDFSNFSLICLSKQVNELFPIWFDNLSQASFPNELIQKRKKLAAQQLKRELAKNNVIAYREFTSALFGDNHFYGYNTLPNDYLELETEELKSFYRTYLQAKPEAIILSGAVDESLLQQIEVKLKTLQRTKIIETPLDQASQSRTKFSKLKGSQKNQTSLRIGRRVIGPKHPDHVKFQLLNVILGGYFGSRLVKNIREEKGYCYHIDSSYDTLLHDAYFGVSADVGNDNVNKAIKEIKNEIKILRNESVPKDEFRVVKNYLLGQILALIDGPFAKASVIKSYLNMGLNPLVFNDLSDKIKEISPDQILETAQKYLKEEDFLTIQVGN